MPLIGSAPLTPQGGRVGKNSIKLPLVRENRHEFDLAKHKVVVVVFDDTGARDQFCQTHTRRILVSRQNSMI